MKNVTETAYPPEDKHAEWSVCLRDQHFCLLAAGKGRTRAIASRTAWDILTSLLAKQKGKNKVSALARQITQREQQYCRNVFSKIFNN